MGDLIQNEKKHRYHSGIQRRWLLNIVSWLVAFGMRKAGLIVDGDMKLD